LNACITRRFLNSKQFVPGSVSKVIYVLLLVHVFFFIKHFQAEGFQDHGRHLTILPHISFSKGLYVSTSCPGGLNDCCDSSADSSSSIDSAESADEEESNLPSSLSDERELKLRVQQLQANTRVAAVSGQSACSFTETVNWPCNEQGPVSYQLTVQL